jgi:hypothetical protein
LESSWDRLERLSMKTKNQKIEKAQSTQQFEAKPKGLIMDLPIEQLVKADWNYKRDNEFIKSRLIENMRRTGQIENIVVRQIGKDKYEVVNGNHRLDAMLELGFKKVMAYNLGVVSDATARRIAIELNETKFEADMILLSKRINEILNEINEEELKQTLPFTDNELEDLKTIINFKWDINDEDILPSNTKDNNNTKVNELTFTLTKELKDNWERWKEVNKDGNLSKEALLVKALRIAIENSEVIEIEKENNK